MVSVVGRALVSRLACTVHYMYTCDMFNIDHQWYYLVEEAEGELHMVHIRHRVLLVPCGGAASM